MQLIAFGPYATGDETEYAFHVFMRLSGKVTCIPSDLLLTEERKIEIEKQVKDKMNQMKAIGNN